MYDPNETHSTAEHYSPHDLLPAPPPMSYNPPQGYFYNNVAKHLIRDTVRIMNNGLHIDLDRVEELEQVLDDQLATVTKELSSNPLIIEFQELQHKQLIADYIADRTSKLRTIDYYLKPFNHKDIVHRSYFMHFFAISQDIPPPTETLPGTTIGKWPTNLVKTFSKNRPLLQRLLDGKLTTHTFIDKAMLQIATDKANIYNQKYRDAIQSPNVPIPEFNPGSSQQKQKLFAWLGIESDKLSKETGLPSFDRDVVEEINKTTIDENVKHFTQQFIDYSFAAIVRNNFIEAFYKYSVLNPDGTWRLHGQYKLFGAKTFRPTSQNPNLLNLPSTKSIFAGPIKRCFTAPPGKVICAIDLSALENRVIANLANEQTLITMYNNDLDGHCVNSLYYFREEIAEHIELTGDLTTDSRRYAELVDNKHSELKAIRQKGKPVSFGLQYGAYPPKVANSIKCSLSEAEVIFNRYHNELYPNVTKFREEYVLPTAIGNGKIHLGLGCYINTDNAQRDIRTITNGCSQFWSVITLLALNKMHQLIDDAGLQNDIKMVSTIYDALYAEVTEDAEIIKWYNDNIVPVLTAQYLENEVIHNLADLEIGYDWYTVIGLSNDASLDDVKKLLNNLKTDKN